MDNLNISNLDCPQFVDFNDILEQDDVPGDVLRSPSSLSAKHCNKEVMVVAEQSPDPPGLSIPSHLHSPCSNITNHYPSPGGYSLRSGTSQGNYPVYHPNNVSLPGRKGVHISENDENTKCRKFNIKASEKRKREDEYIPLAQQVEAFQKKTPLRFRSQGSKEVLPNKPWSPLTLTIPVSPNLQAAKRKRGTHYLSQEEKEALEVKEMKRYQFRARPVREGILQRRLSLKAMKKAASKPNDVQLKTAQRASESAHSSYSEEKPYAFRARPVPATIYNGPTGIKEKPVLPVTQPKTPNFKLKERAEKWKSHSHFNETIATFKAQPVRSFDSPFEVKHVKKTIEVQPFSFDEKDKQRMMEKEKKIMEEIEKERKLFEFKAQPMPSCTPSRLPAVAKKPVTQAEPFHFHAEELHRHSHFDSTTDELISTFKAQPATVLKRPPFIPEKSEKQPLEIKDFQLHTDVRASERLKLKEIQAAQEREREQALQHLRQLQEEEEQREIARLRREAVHKANPVPVFKPFEPKKSSKPLTTPVSPQFRTEERLQKKQSCQDSGFFG